MNLNYMKLKEIINLYCDYGKHVVISDGKKYKIFSPFKHSKDGNYRCSYRKDCVLDCSYTISIFSCTNDELSDLEKTGWKFHSVWIPPAPKRFEVGQLVDVLENARDIGGFDRWNERVKEMVGQKGLEIKYIDDMSYEVWQKDKKGWGFLPHECLAPHIPEQNTDILIKDGKKYKVQIIEEIQ